MPKIDTYLGGSSTSFQNLWANSMEGTDEFVNVGDHPQLSFAGAMTGIIWLNRDSTAGNRCLFSKFQGSMLEYYAVLIGTTLRFLCFSSPSNFKGRTAPMATVGSYVGLAFVDDGGTTNASNQIYRITGGTVTQIDTADLAGGLYTGKTNTTASFRIGAIDSPSIWFMNGDEYHIQMWNVALTTAQLAEIGANPHKDARSYSFSSGLVYANHYPNGQADFPNTIDYDGGATGTMTNQESTDISNIIP